MTLLHAIIAGLLGVWASVLAHAGWGNFHDGTRSMIADKVEGRLPRAALIPLVREAAAPFVLGGLLLSVFAGVPIAHWFWIPAETLGAWAVNRWSAGLFGALWGLCAWGTVHAARWGAAMLPVPLVPLLERAGAVSLVVIAFFPALAVVRQFGTMRGIAAVGLSAAAAATGAALHRGSPLTGAAVGALLPGVLLFVLILLPRSGRVSGPDLSALGKSRRSPRWALLVTGALLAAGAHEGVLSWSVGDGIAVGLGWRWAAVALLVGMALTYFSVWAAASVTTGLVQVTGTGLALAAGLAAPSLLWALAAGAVTAAVETALPASVGMAPHLREAGENLRWALNRALHLGLLAGGVVVTVEVLPGGLGSALLLIAVTVCEPMPIWKAAVPVWALILIGVVANIWQTGASLLGQR